MDEISQQSIAKNESADSSAAQGAGVEPAASLASNLSCQPSAPQQLMTSSSITASTKIEQGAATISTSSASISASSSLSSIPTIPAASTASSQDVASVALRQLKKLEKPVQKRFIQKITVIDTKKLQQFGLDRKIAEALSKQKLINKQEPKPTAVAAAVADTKSEPTKLDLSKLTPAERLAHAKKLLNRKLLAIAPTASKTTATVTSTSTPPAPPSPLSSSSSSSSSSYFASTQNNAYATVKLEKEQPTVYKKLPVRPPKNPQEIARALDFSNMNKNPSKLVLNKNRTKLDLNGPKFVHNFYLNQNKSEVQHNLEFRVEEETTKLEEPQIQSQSIQNIQSKTDPSSELDSVLMNDSESQANAIPQIAAHIKLIRDKAYHAKNNSKPEDKPKVKKTLNTKPRLSKTLSDSQKLPITHQNPKTQPQLPTQPQPQPQFQLQPQLQTQKQLKPQIPTQSETVFEEQPKLQTSTKQLNLQSPQQLTSHSPLSSQRPSSAKMQLSPVIQQFSGISDMARPALKTQTINLTYEDVFEDFSSIPKASIKPLEQSAETSKRTYSKNKVSKFLPASALKNTFPTTTMPKDGTRPEISNFKKPPPPLPKQPLDIPHNLNLTLANDDIEVKIEPQPHPHTHNLIVLEDKVLKPDEKLDLTLFGLDDKCADTDPVYNSAAQPLHQNSGIPAIGATVSTDPQKGLVVVNAAQPKKFIIAPDKLKLSKDKIAALAKQIKTQALQQTKGQQNCVPAFTNVQTQPQQLKSLSPTEMQNSDVIENKSAGSKTTPQQTLQTLPSLQAPSTTPTLHTVKIENLEKIEGGNVERKVGKIIKLEPRQFIRDQILKQPIMQSIQASDNVGKVEPLGNKPQISLDKSSIQNNSIEQKPRLQEPQLPQSSTNSHKASNPNTKLQKIVKIVSFNDSELILSNTAVQSSADIKNIQIADRSAYKTPTSSIAMAVVKPSSQKAVIKVENPHEKSVNIPSSNIIDATRLAGPYVVNKSSPAVRILKDASLNESSISAVDFIASLAASTDFKENSPFELSEEEKKLNATLGMSFSPLKAVTASSKKVAVASSQDTKIFSTPIMNCDGASQMTNEKEIVNPHVPSEKIEKESLIEQIRKQLPIKSSQGMENIYNSIQPHENKNMQKLSNCTAFQNDRSEGSMDKNIQNNPVDKKIFINPYKKDEKIIQLPVKKIFSDIKSDSDGEILKVSEKQEKNVDIFLSLPQQDVIQGELNHREHKLSKEIELIAKETTTGGEFSKYQKEAFSDRVPISKEEDSLKQLNLFHSQKQKMTEENQKDLLPNREALTSNEENRILAKKQESLKKPEILNVQECTTSDDQQPFKVSKDRTESERATNATSTQSVSSKHILDCKNVDKVVSEDNQNPQLSTAAVPNADEQAKSQKRAPRIKKGKINLVTRKKSVAAKSEISGNKSSQSQQILPHDVSTVEVSEAISTPMNSTTESEVKTSRNIEVLIPVGLESVATTVSSNTKKVLDISQSVNKNEKLILRKDPESVCDSPASFALEKKEQKPSEKTKIIESLAESDSDELGLTPHGALEILQGTSPQRISPLVSSKEPSQLPVLFANEQNAKEAEAAQILVSLIQPPPPRDEEQPLPLPKIPFKRKSLEEKRSLDQVVGIQHLLKKIEENELEKPVAAKVETSSGTTEKKISEVADNENNKTDVQGTTKKEPNQVPISHAASTDRQLDESLVSVSKLHDGEELKPTKSQAEPHKINPKEVKDSLTVENSQTDVGLPEGTTLTSNNLDATKKENTPSKSMTTKVTKKDLMDVKSIKAILSNVQDNLVETSRTQSKEATLNESSVTNKAISKEATVLERKLSEEPKNIGNSECKKNSPRQKRSSESKTRVNETILENVSRQTRSTTSNSPVKMTGKPSEIKTVERIVKESLKSNPVEGISKEVQGLDEIKKASVVTLKTKEIDESARKSDRGKSKSKSKEIIDRADEGQVVRDTTPVNVKNNTNVLTPPVERRRTRSESKIFASSSSPSAINKVEALAETGTVEKSEDAKNKNAISTASSIGPENLLLSSVTISCEESFKDTKNETKTAANVEILEKEHKSEITTLVTRRPGRRSKSNAFEKDLKPKSKNIEKTLDVNGALITHIEKEKSSTSMTSSETASDLKVDIVLFNPESTAGETVNTTESLTEKGVKRPKRSTKAQSPDTSQPQATEEGETVAKKARKCSLVSFETSFVTQTKEDKPMVNHKEHSEQHVSIADSLSAELDALQCKPVIRTYTKRRLESKQSTADTQSDIDITDIDYSTIEDSHEDTTKEESSQDSRINIASRKRLRKTVDDIKRGRATDIHTDDTDSDDDYNGDCNEFLGFDELLPNDENTERITKKDIKKIFNPIEVENHVNLDENKIVSSSGDKSHSEKIKDWLTTGKAGQPPPPKAVGKKTVTSPSIKQTAKSIPLKKRWELAQKKRHIETDITDDTSPAQDDDEEIGVENKVAENKVDVVDNTKVVEMENSYQKLLGEYSDQEISSESLEPKKSKLMERKEKVKSPNEHIFAIPQSKKTSFMNLDDRVNETALPDSTAENLKESLESNGLISIVQRTSDEQLINETANLTNINPPQSKQVGGKSSSCKNKNKPHLDTHVTCADSQTTSGEIPNQTVPTALPPQKRRRKTANKSNDGDESLDVSTKSDISLKIAKEIKPHLKDKTVLVEPLPLTPADEPAVNTPPPKKRGRKPKVAITPIDIEKECEISLTLTPSTPQEVTPDIMVPSKRGRKPKKFFEDFVIETKVAKSSTPLKTITSSDKSDGVSNAEQSGSESIITTTPLNITTGPRKRGRKPKQSTLNTSASFESTVITADATESETTAITPPTKRSRQSKTATSSSQETSPVMEKPNKPKSIIEIFTSSLSTNPDPKKSKSRNENLGEELIKAACDATDGKKENKNKIIDKSCEKVQLDEESKAAVDKISVKKPARGKRGPKKADVEKSFTPDVSDSNAQNGILLDLTKYNKDSIYPRVLLITKREQLDSEEKLTVDCGEPDDGYVKCALCWANVKTSEWTQHLAEHYGIGWKVGSPRMDISTKNCVINLIISFLKENNIKALNCRLCNRVYRSGLGLITHLENCGISAEEQLKARVPCNYCKNTYTPLSLKSHERACPVRLHQLRKEIGTKTDVEQEDSASVVFNNVGRVKRNAQMKAENKLKVIGEELSAMPSAGEKVDFVPENHIRYEQPFNIADHEAKCLEDLQKFGKTYCVRKICRFIGKSFAEFSEHVAKCKFIRKPGYYCTYCKRGSAFANQNLVLQHVVKKHGPREGGNDFEGSDGSDCKIDGSDSSSDECSSGVDSNEVDEGIDDGGDDDADVIDEQKQKKKSNRSSLNQSYLWSTSVQTDRKQLFPCRGPLRKDILSEKWEQFCKHNYTDNALFESSPVKFSIYNESGEIFEKLLPRQQASLKFVLTTNNKINKTFGIGETRDDWQQLRRFEIFWGNADSFIFIGGPVKKIAWAPLPNLNDTTQYLAICYRKDYDKFTRSLNPKIAPTLIVIFKVIMDNNTEGVNKIQLHYALRIPYGPVHCFDFLPSGGYDRDTNRLGLLAVGTASSDIQIYALPLEISNENIKEQSEEATDNLNPIVLDVKPLFTLSLDVCNMEQNNTTETIQVTCLKWSQFRGHSHIVASFSNGFIGIWDISGSENDNLNCLLVNETRTFVPLNYFFTGERGVRDFAVHYDINGLRWLAVSGFARYDVIYDIRELSNPSVMRDYVPKNVVGNVEWPVMGECIMYSMCDAIVNYGSNLSLRSPTCIGFSNAKIDSMLSAVNQVNFNPYQCVFYSGTDNGDIVFHRIREIHCGLRRKLSNSIRAIATLDMKYLNGEKMPQAADKNQNSFHIIEPDYKEKYGLVFRPVVKFSQEVDTAFKSTTRLPPFTLRCHTRIKCLSCNLNPNASKLVAFGYENGFLRIMNFNDSKYLS